MTVVTSLLRALPAALALLLVLATAAGAATRDQILEDCSDDGRLDGDYSAKELRDARHNIPTDVDEYTDCRDLLRRAELAKAGRGGGSGSAGSGATGPGGTSPGGGAPGAGSLLAPGTPKEHAALKSARAAAGPGADVGGRKVIPGAAGFAADAARSDIPPALLAVLVLLALGGAAGAFALVRRRVGGRGSTV